MSKIPVSGNPKRCWKLEIAIFKNDKFIKNSSMVFAHLPKSLKAKLNPK